MALVGALLIATAACQSPPSSQEAAPPNTVSVPQSRQEAIVWSRAIDPCALIDRQALQSLGRDLLVGVSEIPSVCEAVIDGGPERGGVGVKWKIGPAWLDPESFTSGNFAEIDGKRIYRTDRYSGLSPEERAELGESGCDYFISYEKFVMATLSVSAAPNAQTCSPPEALVRSMLANVARQPKQGTSTDTAVTALTGMASACMAVPDLQSDHRVEFAWERQMSGDKCILTVDGARVTIDLQYRERATIPAEARQKSFEGYTGFEYERGDGTFIDLVVGEEFSALRDRRSTRLVPIIRVLGGKPAVAQAVASAALRHLPH
ncbi:hypothetical protein [Nocardia gipuzkoensis]|uniref:hypothetical protein n=1 Tax=Nocardia gipuzkoensis TaxID=2749991 RepID=UPI003EE3D312